jgi:peptidoglycan/LPS O-acetylase OafA/YrhL
MTLSRNSVLAALPARMATYIEFRLQDSHDAGAGRGFPQPVSLTPTVSAYLDIVRSLAAFIVVLGHWRAFYFVDYGQVQAGNATSFVKALYASTRYGHQAVMVFFVMSGFFISSSILRSFGRQTWSWRDYAIDRGVRLYLVLIPGLLLGLLWDWLGMTFFNSSGIYSAPLVPFGENVPANTLTPITFLGNLLFLQTRFTQVFGSNGPLWSLFNEFWYYLLFPALIVTILSFRRRAVGTTIGYLLLVAFTIWVLRDQVFGFMVWLAGCGVALALHYLRFADTSTGLRRLYVMFAGTGFIICLLANLAGNLWLGSDLAVGLSFALLMHGILQVEVPIGAAGRKLAKTFAGFSYTLYVVHFPLLLFIRARWQQSFRWQPDMLHLAYGSCIIACVMLYAFGIARITESNTASVRGWIRNRIVSDFKAPERVAQN